MMTINFLKYKKYYFIFSLLIFATFIGTAIYKYQTRGSMFLYSVDYTGGTQILIKLSKPVHSEKIAQILEKNGFRSVLARDFSKNEILIRIPEHSEETKGLAEKIKEIVEKEFSLNVEIAQIDSVGATTSESLWYKSILAVIIGLILMLLYTWWRFWSFAFGTGVLMALFHDAIVILTFFMLFNYEISSNVIAAILAILGYSINDTIVIFARVRENLRKYKNLTLNEIVNKSLNETLRRTLLLSLATALVVISLLIFGGHTLRTLSIALLIGITFGTYSSIAIASPIMIWLYGKKKQS